MAVASSGFKRARCQGDRFSVLPLGSQICNILFVDTSENVRYMLTVKSERINLFTKTDLNLIIMALHILQMSLYHEKQFRKGNQEVKTPYLLIITTILPCQCLSRHGLCVDISHCYLE